MFLDLYPLRGSSINLLDYEWPQPLHATHQRQRVHNIQRATMISGLKEAGFTYRKQIGVIFTCNIRLLFFITEMKYLKKKYSEFYR